MSSKLLDQALTLAGAGYGYGLPPQTVSIEEKKSDRFKKGCRDFFVNEARMLDQQKIRDVAKYKMLSPDYKYKNHSWVVDPLGLGDKRDEEYGAVDDIQHFPIVNIPLNTILGERISRQTQWSVFVEDKESINRYTIEQTEQLFEYVSSSIMQQAISEAIENAQRQGIQIDEQKFQEIQQQVQQNPPEAIQDYMDNEYVDVVERAHNRILKNLFRRNDLESEFIEGFKSGCFIGKEYYVFNIVNNRLKIMNMSPFNVFGFKSPHARWFDEGQYGGYRLFLTMSSIIDMFRDKLTLEDIKKLEEKSGIGGSRKGGGNASLTGIKSINYSTNVYSDFHGNTFDVNQRAVDDLLEQYFTTGSPSYDRSRIGLYEVVQAYWKSHRKVGILTTYLANGEPVDTLVDEFYEPDVNAGENVQWYYLNQVYQGTFIDDDIITDFGPFPFQIFDEEDPDYSPLPIVGGEYNVVNGKPIAIFDLMAPWAELYDIVADSLKKDLKKAIGKVMYMSLDNIPQIEGFDMNKWMYWAREFGIAWVSSNGKQSSSFSHYSAQDMSFADMINAKIAMLERIKINCDAFAGFSQSRVAGISNSPTQGQDQQKLVSSVNQTEYYFWRHTKICERVLTHALNIEKVLVKRRNDKTVFFDDMEQRYIETDIDKVSVANSKLYVVNNGQLITKREMLRQMAMSAAGKTGQPMDMAELIMADTLNEINSVMKKIQKAAMQAQQEQIQAEQQNVQAQIKDNQEQREWDKEKHYSTMDNNLQKAYISTFGRQQDNMKDTDASGVPDILEGQKVMEEIADNMRKDVRERMKLSNEKDKNDKAFQIQKEKNAIAKEKNQIDLKNQENDLEISRNNMRGRNTKK